MEAVAISATILIMYFPLRLNPWTELIRSAGPELMKTAHPLELPN